jgi:hypothetical protein
MRYFKGILFIIFLLLFFSAKTYACPPCGGGGVCPCSSPCKTGVSCSGAVICSCGGTPCNCPYKCVRAGNPCGGKKACSTSGCGKQQCSSYYCPDICKAISTFACGTNSAKCGDSGCGCCPGYCQYENYKCAKLCNQGGSKGCGLNTCLCVGWLCNVSGTSQRPCTNGAACRPTFPCGDPCICCCSCQYEGRSFCLPRYHDNPAQCWGCDIYGPCGLCMCHL